MSMDGNPHYQNCIDQVDAVEDVTMQEILQSEATLALAYEQRTANLIAKLALNAQAYIAADIRMESTTEAWDAVDDDILARLGLNGDAK